MKMLGVCYVCEQMNCRINFFIEKKIKFGLRTERKSFTRNVHNESKTQ